MSFKLWGLGFRRFRLWGFGAGVLDLRLGCRQQQLDRIMGVALFANKLAFPCDAAKSCCNHIPANRARFSGWVNIDVP